MSQKDVLEVSEKINRIVDAYLNDVNIIFDKENERKGLLFSSIADQRRSWNKERECIFHGCKTRSIKRSHTIQKSGPLEAISENSLVLTQKFNHATENLELVPVGIGEASTFPGFCRKHEMLFEEFEKLKRVQNAEHSLLQLYRSICREVVRLEHQISIIRKRIDDYRSFRNKKLIAIANAEFGDKFLTENRIKINKIKFNCDPRIDQLGLALKGMIEDLEELNRFHLQEFTNALLTKDMDKAFATVFVFDVKIPVCLSGLGFFNYLHDGQTVRTMAVLNVLPYEHETVIMISTRKEHEIYVKKYLSELSGPFDVINMVENWMIYGTDHWFLAPAVWNQIRPQFQAKILEDVQNYDQNIGHGYEVTIFNSLKKQIIKDFDEFEISKKMPLVANKMKAIELQKFTD